MKANASASISKESEWLKEIKKAKPWFSKSVYGLFALFLLMGIDTGGFVQGMLSFLPNMSRESIQIEVANYLSMSIMTLGFIAAFEGASLYMAYAFSLKLYHYDRYAIKRSRNGKKSGLSSFVSTTALGWFSFATFVLGIIANSIFRFGILYGKDETLFKQDSHMLTLSGAITIVMILLPIITSILNFVIGCFTFDPLLFELNHLAKNLAKIKSEINALESEKEQVDIAIEKIPQLAKDQKEIYSSKVVCAVSLRPALRSRIYE